MSLKIALLITLFALSFYADATVNLSRVSNDGKKYHFSVDREESKISIYPIEGKIDIEEDEVNIFGVLKVQSGNITILKIDKFSLDFVYYASGNFKINGECEIKKPKI